MNTNRDFATADLFASKHSGGNMGSLRIGITIGLRDPGESLWLNGIKQNALYLAKLFKHSPHRHRVVLVNTTSVPLTASLPWDQGDFPTAALEAVKDSLDVLIELGGQISAEQTRYLKARGTKLVSYCCGPEYVQNMEGIIFGRGDANGVFINEQYDEIWVIPQIVETSKHFFKALRRRPVRDVPFVWDPMCLQARAKDLPHQGEYRPRNGPRRLTVMEPNHDVLKFCLYPMLIADTAFRAIPDQISYMHVTNTEHFVHRSGVFLGIAQSLEMVRQHKASFVGRHDTPQFLSEYTDIVISHQWGLALNYFYFDVCWNGYALVHNAHLCRELGYFYNDNDVDEGATQLVNAVQSHDTDWAGYRERQREVIAPFLATSSALAARYDSLLEALMVAPGTN